MDTFTTDSMALAAYLLTHDFPSDEDGAGWVTDPVSGRRSMVWAFARDEELDAFVADYHSGDAVVDPKTYNAWMARLKRQIHGR